MIEVVIVDDLEYFRNNIKEIVINEFNKKNIKIKVFQFEKYDKNFWKTAKSNNNYKLFILDIEVPGVTNGIDAARKIRESDTKSDILFITAYDTIKYKNLILFSTIKPLSFLNKKNIKVDLMDKISYIENIVNKSQNQKTEKMLIFRNGSNNYQLIEKNIDFLEVNKINHKLIVYLVDSIIEIDITIQKIEELLNEKYFLKVHRSCIINLSNIKQVDYKTNCITFYSENYTKLLSRNKKKELKNRLKDKQY